MAIIPRWQTPISRWSLEGNANDLYGLHNGTPTNITYSTDAKEKGLSGSFNGSSSVINCGNWSFFSYTNISISLWFKVTGTHDAFLTCTRPGYDFPRVQFILDSAGYLNYTIVNNSGSVLFSQGGPMSNDGVWHHICVTDANGTVSSYLDGSPTTPSGSYSRSNLSNLTTVNMGMLVTTSNARPFAGLMDDVRFYDVALTADEVMNLYKSYATPIWQQPLHHWKLDGNATDNAGNINGTAVGTVVYSSSQKVSGNYSMLCDGGADFIDLGAFRFYEHTNFSIALWFKISGTGEKCFLSDSYTSIQSEIRIISNSNTLYYQVIKTGSSIFNDSYIGTFNDNKWHHLVICDANGVVTSYLDTISISINGTYTRVAITLDHSSIGATRVASGTRYFTGNLDDIRFYDVALSAADVRALYNSYFTEKASNFMSIL